MRSKSAAQTNQNQTARRCKTYTLQPSQGKLRWLVITIQLNQNKELLARMASNAPSTRSAIQSIGLKSFRKIKFDALGSGMLMVWRPPARPPMITRSIEIVDKANISKLYNKQKAKLSLRKSAV